ncbi:unnamed protein product [Mucor circinelloides]
MGASAQECWKSLNTRCSNLDYIMWKDTFIRLFNVDIGQEMFHLIYTSQEILIIPIVPAALHRLQGYYYLRNNKKYFLHNYYFGHNYILIPAQLFLSTFFH